MKRAHEMRNILSDMSGETLVETLVALLVAVMGIAMLSMAIATSGMITHKTTEAARTYYSDSNKLVEVEAEATCTVNVSGGVVGDESDYDGINVNAASSTPIGNIAVVAYEKEE